MRGADCHLRDRTKARLVLHIPHESGSPITATSRIMLAPVTLDYNGRRMSSRLARTQLSKSKPRNLGLSCAAQWSWQDGP
jgi:hypothetical protein